MRIPTARAFLPFLQPKLYKGAAGGRGSGKSHFFAENLVREACTQHIRAACVREVQTSLDDSVKRLIEDKIRTHGVERLFRITQREIVGPHDSLFIFKGLQTHTASRIKSVEGFNRCFVEEAQSISQSSLDMLLPTFRNEGSEMWFAWNPSSDEDPVDKLFLENLHDDDFLYRRINFAQNRWFPSKLRKDMERDKLRDYDKYLHVWMGEYQQNSEARVFRNWRIDRFELPMPDIRAGKVIPLLGADWGGTHDPTVLVRCWIVGWTLFIDKEAYDVGCPINQKPALFRAIEDKLCPDVRKWPITADSAWPDTISYMQAAGFTMSGAKKGAGSVEEGVEFLKNYDIVVHPSCVRTIDELAHYSYKVDQKTQKVTPLLKDTDNHVIDALRYAVESTRHNTAGLLEVYREQAAEVGEVKPPDFGFTISPGARSTETVRMWPPSGFTTVYGLSGALYQVDAQGTMNVATEDVGALRMAGFREAV